MKGLILGMALLAAAPSATPAQSVLERSPNLHGVWTLPRWDAAFVFAHRFEFIRGGDELFNVPTLTLALGLPLGLTAGLDYSSLSEVVPDRQFGNETQYWLKRAIPLGGIVDAAALVAYNSVARSWDGALNVRRPIGPVSLFAELRGFSDRFGSADPGYAGAVGATLRLTDYLGLTADVGRVLDTDSIPAAWSSAVAIAIPGTPHTFSLQATNGGAITLQGASRRKAIGDEERIRYGFVFTVPLTGSRWSRIFVPGSPAPPAPASQGTGLTAADTAAVRVEMRMVAYAPAEVRIKVGESVEWINRDPIEHTVTANDGSWGSEIMAEGARYVRRFDRPGRYPYHCTPHPQMQGVVIVEDG